jgi:hypothetical protein
MLQVQGQEAALSTRTLLLGAIGIRGFITDLEKPATLPLGVTKRGIHALQRTRPPTMTTTTVTLVLGNSLLYHLAASPLFGTTIIITSIPPRQDPAEATLSITNGGRIVKPNRRHRVSADHRGIPIALRTIQGIRGVPLEVTSVAELFHGLLRVNAPRATFQTTLPRAASAPGRHRRLSERTLPPRLMTNISADRLP